MATRKVLTKDEKIKKEQRKVKKIFTDLDVNKKKLVDPLIEKVAFMNIELDDLQKQIITAGWTAEYKNGANQFGTKKSPEAETYIALSKNYTAAVKQLTDLVPAAKQKDSALDLLRRNQSGTL